MLDKWTIEYFPPSNEGRRTIKMDSLENVLNWVDKMLPCRTIEMSADEIVYVDELSTAVAILTVE